MSPTINSWSIRLGDKSCYMSSHLDRPAFVTRLIDLVEFNLRHSHFDASRTTNSVCTFCLCIFSTGVMSNVALTAISVALGLFYVFFGTLKLAPVISEEMYRSMRKTFIRTYGSFPLSQWTGWNPSPHLIRRVFGTTEVVGGLLLLAGSSILQDISALTLLILMLFHLFGIWNSSGDPRSASNSVVFALLLTCRFVIRAQNNQGTRIRTFRNEVDEDLRRSVALLRKGLLELKEASKRLEESRVNGQPVDKRGSE
ncbi:hypothetical protein AHF37_07121 [Paragonimus kellicotti]|nr:hypothetical protein AHF37_07121 [Paragonimus kellicotti]